MAHPPVLLEYTCELDSTVFQYYLGMQATCPKCGRVYWPNHFDSDGKFAPRKVAE